MLVILLALPLVGCDLDKRLAKEDHKTCERYGFKPGTDAFAKCMETEALHRDKY